MSNIQLKRIEVAKKWLSITKNEFCTKRIVTQDANNLKKYKKLLQNKNPPSELLIFKQLMKVILDSNDSYSITWLCILLFQYYKSKDMFIILPGHWEDELYLKEHLTYITNNK